MSGGSSWPYHGSLSSDSLSLRYENGEVIRPAEAMKPTARAVKELSMTWRRAKLFEDLMYVALGQVDLEDLRADPLQLHWLEGTSKICKEIWGDTWWRHPDIKYRWTEVVDYFWGGALRRNGERLAANLPVEVLKDEQDKRKGR